MEYFPGNWYQCYDKLGDGCSIDFEYPIRLHSKVKWSRATFTKQDNGMITPKAKIFQEVLVVNIVKKRC